MPRAAGASARDWIARSFTHVEDVLGDATLTFVRNLVDGTLPARIIGLFESFREHALIPEPFLVVGLIAVIRRVLVVTAEFANVKDAARAGFQATMIELGPLTALSLVLVVSLVLLRRRPTMPTAER